MNRYHGAACELEERTRAESTGRRQVEDDRREGQEVAQEISTPLDRRSRTQGEREWGKVAPEGTERSMPRCDHTR